MADWFGSNKPQAAVPQGNWFTQNAPQATPKETLASWNPAKVDMQSGAQGTYNRSDIDKGIDVARPIIANTIGDAAGAAVTPFTGGAGTLPTRFAGYTLVDTLMKYLKEQKPESLGSSLGESALESGGNLALGGLLKMLGRGGKALYNADQPEIYKFSPTTSQAATALDVPVLPTVAKTFEDIALGAKQKALDRSAGAGFSQAMAVARRNEFDRLTNGQFNFSMNPQTMADRVRDFSFPGEGSYTPIKVSSEPGNILPGKSASKTFQSNLKSQGTTYNVQPGEPQLNTLDSMAKIDAVIKDPKKLQSTLTTAQENGVGENLKRSLQGYQFGKILNDATEFGLDNKAVRINPSKISTVWNDPEMQDSFKGLYNAKQRADITQFFSNIENTQDKVNSSPIAKKIWFVHGGIGLATGLLTGNMSAGAATSVGTIVSAEVLGRLLTSPKTARFMVALAGGEPLGVSEQYAARAIASVLQGQVVANINADGSKTPVRVSGDKQIPLGQ